MLCDIYLISITSTDECELQSAVLLRRAYNLPFFFFRVKNMLHMK